MKIYNYRFAGVEYQIVIPAQYMYSEHRDLEPFLTDTVNNPHIFNFSVCDSLMPPSGVLAAQGPDFCTYIDGNTSVRYIGGVKNGWQNGYIRAVYCGNNHFVQVKRESIRECISARKVITALAAEHFIAQNNGVILHCSCIEHNGKAIVFTAPSGTGKSTQADLWQNMRGAQIINGDRTALRLAEGVILAEGIPFKGSSEYCKNRSLPLEAVVYLSQAASTDISRLKGYAAFSRIWQGISVNSWCREDMEKVSAVVKHTAETVPVYHLACTPDISAVEALERALKG